MPNPNTIIIKAGRALYGARWQTDLAKDLGVSTRQVRRWAAKEECPRPGIYRELSKLCTRRAKTLGALAEQLANGTVTTSDRIDG